MKRHIHRIIRTAAGAIVLAQLLSGCAAVSAAASQVNWFKVGSYAALRLSQRLNKKAEEREQEIKEQEKEEPKGE